MRPRVPPDEQRSGRPAAETLACPLCRGGEARAYHQDRLRDYYRCPACCLVFVPHWQFLPAEEEKKRYDQHRNSPDDPDYRGFLSRLLLPLRQRLAPGSEGLDFGSGPGPTLSLMFEEAGHSMAIFDPFYAPHPAALERQYDFITTTEVVEHLHDPGRELDRLWTCLKEGGWLGIMTGHAGDEEAFSQWYYKKDPTHVCFFSRRTFAWLARRWGAELTFLDHDAVLLRKGTAPCGRTAAGRGNMIEPRY